MTGSLLRFYLRGNERQCGRLVWWWLLTRASRIGIPGGSAFLATSGFGRHHTLRVPHAWPLSNTQTIEVEFLATDEKADQLLALAGQEHIRLLYARIPIQFGVLEARK